MLGCDVQRAGQRAGHEIVCLNRSGLDVTVEQACSQVVAQLGGDAVVNCAAWTDVDGAESRPDEALAVNGDGAGNLARAAAAVGMPLVHVSTDYVFDGDAPLDSAGVPRAYVESDVTGPVSVYGQTKLVGEQQVRAASAQHTIVRSSWLFGTGGRNFADTMLKLSAERDTIPVVSDQIGCPTWTGHLAPALIGLLERGVSGVVHLAGGGHASWNEFATEIFRQADVACTVLDAKAADMARPALRPSWSALESERDDVLPLPPWQDGLAGYLAARAGVQYA